jgi:hypothetical protein
MAAYDAEYTQPYRRDRQLLRQLEIVRREELGGPVAQQEKVMGRNHDQGGNLSRLFAETPISRKRKPS